MLTPLAGIPNQLTEGASCFAECIFPNGDVSTIIRSGIFSNHNSVKRLSYTVASTNTLKNTKYIYLRNKKSTDKGLAKIFLVKDTIKIHVTITSPLFYSSASKSTISKCGITICIDPLNKRTPYINDSILIVRYPIDGKSKRLSISSGYRENGEFRMNEKIKKWDGYYFVKVDNFIGYTYDIDIPISKLPLVEIGDSIGFNLIATVFDENLKPFDLSWREGNESIIYSPLLFGTLYLKKPLIPVIDFAFALASLLFGILFASIVSLIITKFAGGVKEFEATEEEEKTIKKINTIVDNEITNINFSIENIATKLALSSKDVARLIKKYNSMPFNKYILKCRLEVVKERLRSSNSSEVSIAKGCGFNSVESMEKGFKEFYKISPYKFREKNKVT
jgi:AraC-like DNA-binding protein